jgi:hypothetical protein
MALNTTGGRNTPNSSAKLADAAVEVMHKYQQLGADIEHLRDFLAARDERAGIDLRIAACFLSCSTLGQFLAKMQIAALNEGGVP